MFEVGKADVERAGEIRQRLAVTRCGQGMELSLRRRDRKWPGHGDADHVFGQHDERVAGLNSLVALRGIIGITGAGKGMMAPCGKSEAFAIGQCDVKSLK